MRVRGGWQRGAWLVGVLVCVSTHAALAAAPVSTLAPARAALLRLLPRKAAAQFTFVALRGQGGDRFRVSGAPGHIVVAGTTPAVMLTGVEAYLEQVVHVGIGWPGDSLARLPSRLPAPAVPIESRARVPDRYALNDTDDGYANAYLGWPEWEHKIDLLALHGINEVFVPIGTAEVYRRAFRAFGYTDAALRAWIPAPAHQPWWLLQNMSGFDAPIPPGLFAQRVALARRIVALLRSLGMTPVLPGYFGSVPPGFAARQPGADVVPQGTWVGFRRPDWVDPCDPHFSRVAAKYYLVQRALFGDSTLYRMSLLHEGGRAGNVQLSRAAACVMHALQLAHPGARWVMLGWQKNPRPEVLAAIDHRHLLIVDGLSDRYDGLDHETTWGGAPYAFGTIPNFGGHTTLGANAGVWVARFRAWLEKPGSGLRGIAWMPEASGNDPAAFALFTALAWSPVPRNAAEWFARYARWRYGGADPHAEAAWRILAGTAYAMPSGQWSEAQDSLFDARPSLDARTAATWSPDSMRYDAGRFAQAVCQLLEVAPPLRATSAYRYDLVDITRQALANRARVLLPQLKLAYADKNAPRFHALATQWLGDMDWLDRLLGSNRHFLLGNWLAPARAAATGPVETAQLEYDQRSILTTWGNRQAAEAGLHDYANRELTGLVGGLYEPRWRRYFGSLEHSLASGTPPQPIDWYAMAHAWAKTPGVGLAVPRGDSWQLANDIARRLNFCRP